MATLLENLEVERAGWLRELSRAAEAWVHARAAGAPTDEINARMREAERQSRRVERRIRRRKRRNGR